MNENKFMFFCDISKAFDMVWHKSLIYKLETVGLTGSLLMGYTDYLKDRTPGVVLNLPGGSSRWTSIKASGPQDSILGPLLFLINITYIMQRINSWIRLFADYTSLYIVVENLILSSTLHNLDLTEIYEWASKWLVTFNSNKTESVIFSRKVNTPVHPSLYMNHQLIKEVTYHKHLDVILSNDLS